MPRAKGGLADFRLIMRKALLIAYVKGFIGCSHCDLECFVLESRWFFLKGWSFGLRVAVSIWWCCRLECQANALPLSGAVVFRTHSRVRSRTSDAQPCRASLYLCERSIGHPISSNHLPSISIESAIDFENPTTPSSISVRLSFTRQ
jgi:hypothetical protein